MWDTKPHPAIESMLLWSAQIQKIELPTTKTPILSVLTYGLKIWMILKQGAYLIFGRGYEKIESGAEDMNELNFEATP